MIHLLNEFAVNDFQRRYCVRSTTTEISSDSDLAVTIELNGDGFYRLITDTQKVAEKTIFDVDGVDDSPVLVARFPFGEVELEVIKGAFENLKDAFPNKTVVAIPNEMTLESAETQVLESIRDMLTSLIEARDYDNLMGVTENT